MKTLHKTFVILFILAQLAVKPFTAKAEEKEILSFDRGVNLSWGKVGLAIGLLLAIQIATSLKTSRQLAQLKKELKSNQTAKAEEVAVPALETLISSNHVTWSSSKIRGNEKADTYLFVAEVERPLPAVSMQTDKAIPPTKAAASGRLAVWISTLIVLVMVAVIW